MSSSSWKKKPDSCLPRAWALEPRLMFDAAAAVDAAHQVVDAQRETAPASPAAAMQAPLFALHAPAAEPAAAATLNEAMRNAETQLGDYLQRPDAADRLLRLFEVGPAQPRAGAIDAIAALQDPSRRDLQLDVRLLTSTQIGGVLAGFSAQGTEGRPTIYLNADWLASGAGSEAVARVLVEETGHALDALLNGPRDTPGDEGEAFAADVLGWALSEADRQRIAAEDDHGTLLIDGRTVEVEQAAITFTQVFRITPSSLSEESNSFVTDPSAVSGSNFRFTSGNPADTFFSGNNVTGTLSYLTAGGTTVSIGGVVSRLVKTGSTVNGLYFYVPGADGTIGTGDDSAYVFRVNESFNFAGATSYGTSSDPVDTALNKLIVPNGAPTARNDAATVLEDGSVVGNVLANDSDPNADALRVSGYQVGGTAYAVAAGASTTAALAGVGSLQVASDGSYTFTPLAHYAGAVPLVSYTVTDGSATATASLALSIAPVNDAPAGSDRTITIAEGTSHTFAAADFGFTDAVDSPANRLQGVVITALPAQGALTLNGTPVVTGQEVLAADLGGLVYAPGASGSGAAYAGIGFQVRDGGGTANGGVDLDPTANTVTFDVGAVNHAPVAGADAATAVEAGGSANATPGGDPGGNLLANDSDPDAGTTLAVQSMLAPGGAAVAPAAGSTSASNPAVAAGLYGTLRVGADGSYVYQIDNTLAAVQALRGTAQTLAETFAYTVRDGSGATSTATLTVTLRGANDAPVAVNDRNVAKEAGPTPSVYPGSDAVGNVLVNDTDVDAGDTRSVVGLVASATAAGTGAGANTITVASVGTPGNTSGVDVGDVLHVTVNGAVVYDKNPTNPADQVTVTAINGTSLTLDRNVSIATGASIEFWVPNPGGQISGNRFYTTSGGSSGATASSTLSLSGISGTVLVGMAVQGTGASTAPTVTTVDYATGQITLSSAVTLAGSTPLTFSMAPSGSIQGQRGTLSLAADGSYTYHITDNSLAAGQTATETFTYRMQDAAGLAGTAVLTITIEGTTNDTEPQANADAVTAVEAGGAANAGAGIDPSGNVVTGTGAAGNAADTGTSLVLTRAWSDTAASVPTATNVAAGTTSADGTVVAGRYGSLVIGADGSYHYSVDNGVAAVQALRGATDTLTEQFFYRIDNGTAGVATTLRITIRGAGDAPVAVADATTAQAAGGVTAAFSPSGNLIANDTDTDVDAGDTLSVTRVVAGNAAPSVAVAPGSTAVTAPTQVAGSYGALAIGADGSYAYVVDSGNAAVRALAAGASLTDTFSYELSDASGVTSTALVTVTVRGANDAPVNALPASHTQPDYQRAPIAGVSVADLDDNLASVTLTVRSGTLDVTGSGATVTGNASAQLTLAGSQAAINTLLATLGYTPDSGFAGADTLTLASTDGAGLGDTDALAITVQPDNRALAVSSPSVNEASPYIVFTVGGAADQRVTLAAGTTGSGTGHATASTDFSSTLEVFDGTGWAAYSGGEVAVPGSGSLLVRLAVLQDTQHEGIETLTLTATNRAGGAAAGTGSLRDDGQGSVLLPSGAVDPGAVADDDRPLAVTSASVNEASPFAVFTVSGAAGQAVDLSLRDGTASGADHGSALQVHDAAANNGVGAWVGYAPGLVLPAGGTLLVRVGITNDTLPEGAETFALIARNTGGGEAVGRGVILDDGSGDIYLAANGTGTPDAPGAPGVPTLDDDRALSVNAPTANEASPYIVFTVDGAEGQRITLLLDTAGARPATLGVDTADAGTGVPLQAFDGAAWLDYMPGSAVAIPLGSTRLLVRTAIAQDTLNEGAETLRLTATNAGGSAFSGVGTLLDDGTGDVFLAGNASGVADPATSPGFPMLDDDRPVAVSSPTVNEASPYAVFTVSGTAGQSVRLTLADGTATGPGTDYGNATGASLQVSADGGATWTDYASAVTLPAGGAVLVRTPIVDDATSDDGETFTLTVTPVGGQATIGTATIRDDGTGDVYAANGSLDPLAPRTDDRTAMAVSSPTVNEASPWAVFTVSGTAGRSVSLLLSSASATGGGGDFGAVLPANLQVSTDGGATWSDYASAVTMPAGGTLLARTAVVDDTIGDDGETFTLTATPAGAPAATGTATIRDDGTGSVYAANGALDPGAPRSDDRAVSVTSPTVNEASPWAVFTVSGTAGQTVGLVLAGGSASGAGIDFSAATPANLQVSTDGGATWANYASAVTLPGSGTLLVRTPVVDDAVSDDGETFTLTATPVGGRAAIGTATIRDDGTGSMYAANGSLDPAAPRTDDRTVSVTSPIVNEASPHAVFSVTGEAGQSVSLVLAAASASGAGTDFGHAGAANLQVSTDGGTTWVDYATAVTLPGTGALLVRTPVVDDVVSDNGETFTLAATPVGGHAAIGTATLRDDGTGGVYAANGSLDPTAARSDDRPLSVSSPIVNEASPYAVFAVAGSAGQSVGLTLAGGTATGAGTDFGGAGGADLQVSTDIGATWTSYAGPVTLLGSGTLLVRTPVVDDDIGDNGETFTLTATPVGGRAAIGTATIHDDGTGNVYAANGAVNLAAPRTDDRMLSVSSPTVNEASPYAIFTVTGSAGQAVALTLVGDSAGGAGVDFGATAPADLQTSTDGGLIWVDYASAVKLPGSGAILVRTPVVNDAMSDNGETFMLTAVPAGGRAIVGTATLRDNGTGTVFRADGGVDAAALRDDDRTLGVSSPSVNEASPFVVFTVSGGAGQQVRLTLQPGSADGRDFGGTDPAQPRLEVFDGSAWVAYTPASWVALGADGKLLVRTAVTNDTVQEGGENFRLLADGTGRQQTAGVATLDDRGSGDVFLAGNRSGIPDAPGTPGYPRLDDDRPRADLAPAVVAPPVAALPFQALAAPLPVVTALPAPGTGIGFDSTLGLPIVGLPGALWTFDPIGDAVEAQRQGLLEDAGVDDIYTRPSGFRTMVTPTREPLLRLFRGLEDQEVPAARMLNLQVPADAFVHTDINETVELVATLADGRPLPAWLSFDGKAGTFSGQPPADLALDLRLKVVARDTQGREAVAMFRIKAAAPAGPGGGRTSFDGQLLRGEALTQRQGQWHSQRHQAARR